MTTGADLVEVAAEFVGGPYELGKKGSAPGEPVDCSGLVHAAAAALGVPLPHGTFAQWAAVTPISVEEAERTPGALLDRPAGSGKSAHNGLSDGLGGVVHASSPSRGVVHDTRH